MVRPVAAESASVTPHLGPAGLPLGRGVEAVRFRCPSRRRAAPHIERFDYEGELAVIIGRGGRRIPRAQALEHVAGYACFDDGSVRDYQRHTSQFTPGKNFDGSGGFGPWMVTADEIPNPSALQLTTRLNGQVMQHASTADLIFDIPALIAFISTFTPLEPGDVIATGTPSGVGDKREPLRYLRLGNMLEVEISGIGTLRHPVVDG